jgi:hypothetical protein
MIAKLQRTVGGRNAVPVMIQRVLSAAAVKRSHCADAATGGSVSQANL